MVGVWGERRAARGGRQSRAQRAASAPQPPQQHSALLGECVPPFSRPPLFSSPPLPPFPGQSRCLGAAPALLSPAALPDVSFPPPAPPGTHAFPNANTSHPTRRAHDLLPASLCPHLLLLLLGRGGEDGGSAALFGAVLHLCRMAAGMHWCVGCDGGALLQGMRWCRDAGTTRMQWGCICGGMLAPWGCIGAGMLAPLGCNFDALLRGM